MSLVVAAYVSALLFGLGLGISGMTLPHKVIGFLDVTGNWDPSLAFVMVGAIAVHSISFRLITKRESPILTTAFHIPTKRAIDSKLIIGSLIFGAGWGLGGFCPGPAIVASVSGAPSVLTFLAFMVAGVYAHKFFNKWFLSKGA